MQLSNVQKTFLKKLGAKLDPSVRIGKEGVNDGVIKNTRAGLIANELVKVKVNQNSAEAREEAFGFLAEATGAELVQVIGRTALLYKPRPEDPKIALP